MGGAESSFVTRLLGDRFLEEMTQGSLLEVDGREMVVLVCIDNVWLSNGNDAEKREEKKIEAGETPRIQQSYLDEI